MSVRDTKYTSPEALRYMYRNPKSAVKDVINDTTASHGILRSPNATTAGGVNTGGGGIQGNVSVKRPVISVPIIRKPDSVPEQGLIEGERL